MKTNNKRLQRTNPSDIGGVCGGLSNYFGIDETLIRLLFVILFFTPFPIFWTYVILWVLTPKES